MKNDDQNWDDKEDQVGGGEDQTGSEGQTGSGEGGKSGAIGFRVPTEIYRDDLLNPREIQRLLQVHEEVHKAFVNKQKLLRKERTALKEGRKSFSAQQGQGYSRGGTASRYKKHPISNKAQFSGMDRQVSILPSENEADTNSKLREELQNRHNYRLQLQRQFNPKPRPY